MDLQSFVKQTLEQIAYGVRAAQESLSDSAVVNPPVLPGAEPRPTDDRQNPVQTVEFDVALTTSESGSDKAGGGLFILGATLGTTSTTGTLNSAVSRVRFTVNLQLPPPVGKIAPKPK